MNALMTSQPVRVLPKPGGKLSISDINGEWRPSGSTGGLGVFAVIWSSEIGQCWAPLHDFSLASQQYLLAQCLLQDLDAGFPGAWPNGRPE